ncbi:MAG: GWxTD domain-containing protein [Acidobacteria bacterium]|nr:MAG: GWxTD domain-containing protein [Acidobacteriota bacterium]
MKRIPFPLLLFVLAGAGKLYAQGTTTDGFRVEMLRNWTEQNVKWIICPAEKAVFKALTSDTEREAFIDAFWSRRDPDPQTTVNEAKQEHYKRMDFADGHFRENETRGSLTERGRVWVMYGPPRHREVHPRTSDNSFSCEIWQYDRTPDIGRNLDLEFADLHNTGEYRLKVTPEKRDDILTLWPCQEMIAGTLR